jgi:uncharacterized protein YndB with AHSA1/START domain
MAASVRRGTTVRLQRVLPARREEVFRAWTQPDLFEQWFTSIGGTSSAEVDAREGGRFDVEMRTPAAPTVRVTGTYLEVVPPERLVFTFEWIEFPRPFKTHETLVTVELHDRGEVTELVLVHERQPHRLAHAFHSIGWRASLRRLARLLGG